MSHSFKRLSREPVYLKVYRSIEQDILTGKLIEGAALPIEYELSEQFGVTRSTVREGIRLLEKAGLVERGPAKRLIVKRPKSNEIAENTSIGLVLGGVTFGEVWETLLTMYPQAARLAASRLKSSDVELLKQVNENFIATNKQETDKLVLETVEFFQCLTHSLNNQVLQALLQSLNILIGTSLKQVIKHTPNAKQRIAKAHKEIISAIANKDQNKAQQWMEKHINDLKRGYKIAGMDMTTKVLLDSNFIDT